MNWKTNNGLPMSDKSDLKYFDIGKIRMQWGRGGQGSPSTTITFPAPFKDTSFTFTTGMSGSADNSFRVNLGARTTTTQAVTKACNTSGSSGEAVDWIAIGLKP